LLMSRMGRLLNFVLQSNRRDRVWQGRAALKRAFYTHRL